MPMINAIGALTPQEFERQKAEWKTAEVAGKIGGILKEAYPNLDDYHIGFIAEMVNDLSKTSVAPQPAFQLPYDEMVRVLILNSIRDQIRDDILKNKYPYKAHDDEAGSDFERGVLAAISLIEHRVHCMCDL